MSIASAPNHEGITLVEVAALAHGEVDYGARTPQEFEDVRFADISLNAQDLAAGGIFAALPGLKTHGARYAQQVAAGLILTDSEGQEIVRDSGEIEIPIVIVDDIRSVLGTVSAAVYGNPSQNLTVIGITGTSGKTTTSYMVEQILLAQHSVGLIGTTGTRINGSPVPSSLTTPEAPKLQQLFRTMADQDVSHVVMEVSSHAIALGRIQGTQFSVVSFLNLSQDHLDFHASMQEYFETKAKLFTDVQYGKPTKIICVDDQWGQRLAASEPEAWLLESVAHDSAVNLPTQPWSESDLRVDSDGVQSFTLTVGERHGASPEQSATRLEQGQRLEMSVAIPGLFNASNAGIAVQVCCAVGVDIDTIQKKLRTVEVPGRMQSIVTTVNPGSQDFLTLVDYAHKPGALQVVLDTVQERSALQQTPGRIAVVFGAGGDRDAGKRAQMGAIAAQGADLIIVTDDNPRSEDPQEIRSAILSGAEQSRDSHDSHNPNPMVQEIGDRKSAIEAAVDWAQRGDIIVVAGKGHETGQIVGDSVKEFSDVEELTRALDRRFSADTAQN